MFAALTMALLAAGAPALEVRTLDGGMHAGEIKEWSAEELTLARESGPVTLAARQLLEVRPAAATERNHPEAAVWVRLRSGSTIAGTEVTSDGKQAQVTLRSGRVWAVPLKQIASLRLAKHDAEQAAQWERIAEVRAAADLIVIRKGEALDYLEGVIGKITGDHVHFTLDGDTIPVKRTKVDGVFFFHPQPFEAGQTLCVVETAGGVVLEAQSVELSGKDLKIKTAGGIELSFPLAELVRASYANFHYLSDLTPLSASWQPNLPLPVSEAARELFGRPARDRALAGGSLSLGERDEASKPKRYSKGLALRSGAEMVYRPPPGARSFRALVGIDRAARPGGHVELVILGDDNKLLERTITGTDEPLAVDLDIAGIRRLIIRVGYGDDLDIADHLDLCEARITK